MPPYFFGHIAFSISAYISEDRKSIELIFNV